MNLFGDDGTTAGLKYLKTASVSPCQKYRWWLRREWSDGANVCWVMLNPSTADGSEDDPTIRRCVSFSKLWGFGSLTVVNLFALRETDPAEVFDKFGRWAKEDIIGAANDLTITGCARVAKRVVCAWGGSGKQMADQRAAEVVRTLAAAGIDLHCLGTTAFGQPRHPLYVKGDTPLQLFSKVPT